MRPKPKRPLALTTNRVQRKPRRQQTQNKKMHLKRSGKPIRQITPFYPLCKRTIRAQNALKNCKDMVKYNYGTDKHDYHYSRLRTKLRVR